MNVAIVGRTQLLYQTALALKQAGHAISAILTASAAPEYTHGEESFQLLAESIGCPFFLCASQPSSEALAALHGLDVAVSVNWPRVLDRAVLDLFPLGVLNAHFGALPRYRGNACPNWAILAGEKEVALSIHAMRPGQIDCGPVLHQQALELAPDMDIGHVYAWAENAVPAGFVAALEALAANPRYCLYEALADDPQGFRCFPRIPEDGYIDWSAPAVEVLRLIRASAPPFASAYTYTIENGRPARIGILKARSAEDVPPYRAVPGHVLGHDPVEGSTLVACGDKPIALLECRDAQGVAFLPGKRWKGVRKRLGVRAEDMLWALAQQPPAPMPPTTQEG